MAQATHRGWIGRVRPLRRLHLSGIGSLRLGLDDPRLRIGLAHACAVLAAAVILVIERPSGFAGSQAAAALVISVGLGLLHTVSARKRLQASTLILDAVGTAFLLAGSGAPSSPFFVMALAGVWWAAHVRRRGHGGVIYGFSLAVAYGGLVAPQAIRHGLLGDAFNNLVVIGILAVLGDWLVRVDRRAVELSEALTVPPFGEEQLAIREGLVRALHTMDIPVDVVLAAGQVGLTAVQAELLAYLLLGLTNVEISDAVGLSEAAVRYRLTHLYRTLGVRGRREAADRARALGLSPAQNGPRSRT